MAYLVVWTFFLTPPLLFAVAWRAPKPLRVPLIPLIASAALLVLGTLPSVKHWLLGANHSDRLYTTLEANLVLVLLLAAYLLFKRNWTAAAGALILSVDWLYLAVVNSVA